MFRFKALSALLLAASLAACGSSGNPPATIDTNASSQMPQPANSLPPGDSTLAPTAPGTGVVGRTRVGRSTRYATRHTVRRHRRAVHHRARRTTTAPASTTAQ